MHDPKARKVIKNGEVYYRLGDAAKLLGTNVVKVREFMSSGELDWVQLRAGSKTLLIKADSLIRHKYPGRVILKVSRNRKS